MSTPLFSPDPTPGARPTGVSDPASAAQNIQQMFDAIAPRYDLLNHLLSAGIDRLWWRRTARALRPILARPDSVVLDLCCGTGDMTLALDKLRPQPATGNLQPATLLAVDFSRNMLALARPKFAGRNIRAIEADALHLPFADASIDLVTCAFGFRNLASYTDGLAELQRVLRPGGQIAILDFNQPTGLMGALYNLYFKHVLPLLGRILSRDPRAYAYLPESVARFPSPPRMMDMIAAASFTAPTWTPYTFGIAGLYRAIKP
ncbi:MAG TPA: bifunctional demethylmenaquinone methyltransferase/2-methoxy-6-polyprenyl-1,4-benzoquinol methylase UbiE [Acidobacteriaceae bacterium]|nr:bifunctional demethylmenaquinone methyltransferase/2-methoxy-6-polyprenyl-1,4-benzoquinol methylase UbiE [Acidobacteriaceae bacterium]